MRSKEHDDAEIGVRKKCDGKPCKLKLLMNTIISKRLKCLSWFILAEWDYFATQLLRTDNGNISIVSMDKRYNFQSAWTFPPNLVPPIDGESKEGVFLRTTGSWSGNRCSCRILSNETSCLALCMTSRNKYFLVLWCPSIVSAPYLNSSRFVAPTALAYQPAWTK